MEYNILVNKIEDLTSDLKLWSDFAKKTQEKSDDLIKFEEELINRENIVKKETEIARQRKDVLDAREKNIENKEQRMNRMSSV